MSFIYETYLRNRYGSILTCVETFLAYLWQVQV